MRTNHNTLPSQKGLIMKHWLMVGFQKGSGFNAKDGLEVKVSCALHTLEFLLKEILRKEKGKKNKRKKIL